MSFVAAAFLAGLAALAVPWWLHRRHSVSDRRRPVSSLLLMRPGEAPEQARRQVTHRLLLALRMILLAALVLAFAQPVLHGALAPAPDDEAARPAVIVLDISASMAASFPAARRLAHDLVDEAPPGARAAVVGVAGGTVVAARLTADRSALHDAVDTLRPGAERLTFDGLAGRLTALAATLTEEDVVLHLISDFQQSAMPQQFNALLAGARVPVTLHPVQGEVANWQVERIHVGEDVAVTVRGHGTPERMLEVTLETARGAVRRQSAAVPADGAISVRFAPLEEPGSRSGDGGWLHARVNTGDALALDDAAFHALRDGQVEALPVIASPGATGQLEYLAAAITAAAPRFRLGDAVASGPVAVLVDPGELGDDRVRLLERHLANGGDVLMTVGPATRRAGRLPLVEQTLQTAPLRERAHRVIAEDRGHPVLADFDGWRDIMVSRHLSAAATHGNVVLALEDGSPLLVEHRLGAGRLLVLMTALDPDWSSLVLRPVFVSFIGHALAYLSEDALPVEAVAGEPLDMIASNIQIFDFSGARLLRLGETVGRSSVVLDEPGIYRLRTPSRERLLAVNPDPRESDLRPADPELLARWETASHTLGPAEPAGVPDPAGEPLPMPLAPWLLALLAVLAVLEPLAANMAGEPSRRSVTS